MNELTYALKIDLKEKAAPRLHDTLLSAPAWTTRICDCDTHVRFTRICM